MANPTTNYGFVLPTATDLVTDLPADFDVALQGVDTRLKALQPGTTLGDLAYSSATANTNTRLGIGSTGNVLTVTGGVPVWAAPASSGGMTLIATGTGTGSNLTITFSSIPSTYKHLMLVFEEVRTATAQSTPFVRFNGNDTSSYDYRFSGTDTSNDFAGDRVYTFYTIANAAAASGFSNGVMWVFDYAGSQANKTGTGLWSYGTSGGSFNGYRTGTFRWRNTAAINSISITSDNATNFGTATVIRLYGVS